MVVAQAPAGTGNDGLGAVLQNGGCSFRVWAPFADRVEVGGDFFNAGNLEPLVWEEVPLERDAPGSPYWSVFIKGVVADSLYKFKLRNNGIGPGSHPGEPVPDFKHDPHARDAVSFSGNSVVVDRNFDWSGDNFQSRAGTSSSSTSSTSARSTISSARPWAPSKKPRAGSSTWRI